MSKHHHLKNTKNIFSAGFDTLWKCIRFSYQTNNYLQQGMSSEAYWVVVSLMDFSNKLTITERQWFNNIYHELCNVYPFVNIFPVLGCWIEKRALFWAIKQLDLEFCVKKLKNHKFFVRNLTSSRIYLVSAKYSYGVWRVGCNILWVSIQRRFGLSCICRVYCLRKSTYFHVMWTLLESVSRFMDISVIANFRWYV